VSRIHVPLPILEREGNRGGADLQTVGVGGLSEGGPVIEFLAEVTDEANTVKRL
jgi:hypothetical protein